MEPVPNRAPSYGWEQDLMNMKPAKTSNRPASIYRGGLGKTSQVTPAADGNGYEAVAFNNGQIFRGRTAAHAKKRMDTDQAQTAKSFKILKKNPDVREAALGQKTDSTTYVIEGKKYRKSAVDAVRKDFNKGGTRVRKAGK